MAGELSLGGDDDPDDDVEPEQDEECEDDPQQDHVNVEVLCQSGADAADLAVFHISCEVLFHRRLLLDKILIHFEEAGDDVGFGSIFGEAVGLQYSSVIGSVGLAEFGRHHRLIV